MARDERIGELYRAIRNAFKNDDSKFRNPSANQVLDKAQRRIATRKNENIVTDEELLQWAIALEATARIIENRIDRKIDGEIDRGERDEDDRLRPEEKSVIISWDKDTQDLVGKIMNRPISEEQLSLLIAVSPGRSDYTKAKDTPFFMYYRNNLMTTDKEKAQKFIKAVEKLPIRPFDDEHRFALLDLQLSDKRKKDEKEQKIYDEGLATILKIEAQKAKEDSYPGRKMLEHIHDYYPTVLDNCPEATKACKQLVVSCVMERIAELNKNSPIKISMQDLMNFPVNTKEKGGK